MNAQKTEATKSKLTRKQQANNKIQQMLGIECKSSHTAFLRIRNMCFGMLDSCFLSLMLLASIQQTKLRKKMRTQSNIKKTDRLSDKAKPSGETKFLKKGKTKYSYL